MGHVYGNPVAVPYKIPLQIRPKYWAVNIPVNTPDRPEGPEPIENFDRPEVAHHAKSRRTPQSDGTRRHPKNRVCRRASPIRIFQRMRTVNIPIFRQIRQEIIG